MKKTIFITGASSGIGAMCAYKSAVMGYNVIMLYNKNDISAKSLYEDLIKINKDIILIKGDLTDKNFRKNAFEKAIKKFSYVDILINNAGISMIKPFLSCDENDTRKIMEINYFATVEMARLAAQGMLKKGGSIVNISSVWGITGASCEVDYSASKAALIGFSKALAKELAPSNIRVNVVAPGVVDTKMNAHLSDDEKADVLKGIPLQRFANPLEIATTILNVANDEYLTGQVISPNGGMVV